MSTDDRRRAKYRVGLFTKLATLSIGLILVTASVVAVFVINAHRTSEDDALRVRGRALVRMAAHISEYGVYTEDSEILLGVVGGLDADEDLAYFEVTDPDQKVLAHRTFGDNVTLPPRQAALPPNSTGITEHEVVVGDRCFVEFVAGVGQRASDPLFGTGQMGVGGAFAAGPIGYVRLGVSTARIDVATAAFVRSVVIFTTLILLVGTVITVVVALRITSPLRRLAAVANQVSGGQISAEVQVHRNDELSDLADAFNAMLARLRDYEEEVAASHQTLEERVLSRTYQLRLAMEQARTLARQAQAANEAKDTFLANMSHELRTPLNAVIGLSQLMVDGAFGEVPAEQEQCLRDIAFSGQHLLSLVQDVLDLAKIEAGGVAIEPVPMSPRAMVDNTLAMLRERAVSGGISLTVDADRAPATIHADSRAMDQVLANLVANALRFTPEGGSVQIALVEMSAAKIAADVPAIFDDVRKVLAVAADARYLLVSVRDTGIGVAPENLRRILEAFQQEDQSTTRAYGGTGLGLSLSAQLVELHGGVLWADSEGRGRGATFSFALPLDRAEGEARQPSDSADAA